jgi:hypothetical protein
MAKNGRKAGRARRSIESRVPANRLVARWTLRAIATPPVATVPGTGQPRQTTRRSAPRSALSSVAAVDRDGVVLIVTLVT